MKQSIKIIIEMVVYAVVFRHSEIVGFISYRTKVFVFFGKSYRAKVDNLVGGLDWSWDYRFSYLVVKKKKLYSTLV